MKRLVGALAFAGATAIASSAMGQEVQIHGPLAGAPSCRHCVQYRAGRFSIAPSFGIGLQEEFDRAMYVGATLNYHFNDLFAIGVYGAYGLIHFATPLTNQIESQLNDAPDGTPGAQTNDPGQYRTANIPGDGMGNSRFYQQTGRINWILSPQLTIVPLRGKLALFQNIFLDTDFYIFGGPAFIGVEERADFTPNTTPGGVDLDSGATPLQSSGTNIDQAYVDNQVARASRVAITGSFGVGINFYITHFLSFAIEYRAFPFSWNTSGTDESSAAMTCGANGMSTCTGFPDRAVSHGSGTAGGQFVLDSNDWAFHWNQMVNFSINIFLPTEPHIGE